MKTNHKNNGDPNQAQAAAGGDIEGKEKGER